MSHKFLALSFGLALLALTACSDDKKPKSGGKKAAVAETAGYLEASS